MMNLPKEKIKTIAIVLLSTTLIITIPMLNHEKQKDEKQYEAFLNEFYHYLDTTLYSVNYILNKPDEIKNWKSHLSGIRYKLDTTANVLDLGSRFIKSEITTEPYFFRNRVYFEFDEKPNEEQLAELENIRDALQYMKDGLFSEETGQENKDLSIDQFNEIISEGAKRGE